MTFSEFAKLLFSCIGDGQRKEDFVIDLVRHIIEEPHSEEDKKLDESGKYVPLPESPDTCYRIYIGERAISKKNASKILSHLDRGQFELYISKFPVDTVVRIGSALQKNGIDIAGKQIDTVCTDLFISILEDCANAKRKPRKKPALSKQAAVAKIIFDTNEIVDTIGIEEEKVQEAELSEPKYYLEYRQDGLEQFEMYDTWNPPLLDPELKEKWGSVCITDEFSKSLNDYRIEDFLKITPSDLLPMRNVVIKDHVIDHIRNANRFVGHMISAIDHMMITKENQEIFIDISNFTRLLRRYLGFLKENSNNSDLLGNTFILTLSDDNELERKVNKYYDELMLRFKDLEKRINS